MLAVAAVIYAAKGLREDFDRETFGTFDGLMVVVLGLALYGLSARDRASPPGYMDRVRVFSVLRALALDLVVLGAMIARIGDLGYTATWAMARGLDVILLINLAVTERIYGRFLAEQGSYEGLQRWLTSYLTVFVIWAAVASIALPPTFTFA